MEWTAEHMAGSIIVSLFGIGFFSMLPIGSWTSKVTLGIGIGILGFGIHYSKDALFITGILALFLGFFASLPIVFLMTAASSIGELIEAGRGMTLGAIVDPTTEFPELPLAILFRWMSLYFLAGTPLFDEKISALKNISSVIAFQKPTIEQMLGAINLFSSLFAVCLNFFACYVLIEFFLAALGKVIPALSLQLESFLLKGCGAYLLLQFLIGAFPRILRL